MTKALRKSGGSTRALRKTKALELVIADWEPAPPTLEGFT